MQTKTFFENFDKSSGLEEKIVPLAILNGNFWTGREPADWRTSKADVVDFQ